MERLRPGGAVTVHVEFMGPILRPDGAGREAEIGLPAGAAVADLLAELGYRAEHARHLGVFRDGQRLSRSAPLMDGERLVVAAPMSGG